MIKILKMSAIDMLHLSRVRKEKHYRGFNPLNKDFSDEELGQRYRFGRESIEFIANELRAELESNTRKRTALSVEEQVMIALRFYGSGSQLQVVGDTMGYDKSTVSRVVRDVTDALVDRKDQYIKWPTESQNNINKRAFYEKAWFPNVIGCIDGTHVHIQAPTADEPAYVNRKGFHSINVQVICDPQGTCVFFPAFIFEDDRKSGSFSYFFSLLDNVQRISYKNNNSNGR